MKDRTIEMTTVPINKIESLPIYGDGGNVRELAKLILRDKMLAFPLQLWSIGATQTYRPAPHCAFAAAAAQEAYRLDPTFEYINCFIDVDFSEQNILLLE